MGVVSTDPNEPNPIRVAGNLVQIDVIKEFPVPDVGTTFQGVPVNGLQIYMSKVTGGPYVTQQPA
jgi:hypothetical protein